MKKVGLMIVGAVAAMLFIANIGSVLGLAVSIAILYLSFKEFLKAERTLIKVIWVVIGLCAIAASASNFPAILGLAAIYVLYIVYKKWNENKEVIKEEDDPFKNFEKQWSEFQRN